MERMRRWQAGAAGVGGVVLLTVGNELTKAGGGSPDLHAPAAAYAGAIGTSDLVLVGVWVVVVAWLLLAVFFRAAGELLRGTPDGDRAARTVTSGGALAAAVGIAAGAPALLSGWVLAADGELTDGLAKALLLMNASVFVLGWLLVAVPMAVLARGGVRRGLFGGVLGTSGVVLAGVLAVASLVVWWVGGVMLAWVAALLWLIVVSVRLAVAHPALADRSDQGSAGVTSPVS
jgi:hypothetical protein